MSKLIPCKACGHQIAKSASKCPSCGKNMTSAARIGLILLLILILLFFFGGGSILIHVLGKQRMLDRIEQRSKE